MVTFSLGAVRVSEIGRVFESPSEPGPTGYVLGGRELFFGDVFAEYGSGGVCLACLRDCAGC